MLLDKQHLDATLRRLGPSLLSNALWYSRWTAARPTTGYCYIVSEVVYHFASSRQSKPHRLRTACGETHWYVMDAGTLLDYTADQYDSQLDYSKGRAASFFRGRIYTPRGPISKAALCLAVELGLLAAKSA